MYQHGLKRVLDFLLALCGLLVLWPVFVIIAAAIKIDDPGPVFFSQKRVGLHKRYFRLYKFRSMKVSTPDVPTHLLEHPEQYISKVGGFLRKYSLDELPQIINILLGQMAVIGPRPALWSQTDLIAQRDQYGANDVRPGLTGWAQINGLRGDTDIAERIRYDIWYIENWTVALDIKILFRTVFGGKMVNDEKIQ